MNFVYALAYPSCLALPAAFTPPGARLLAEPFIYIHNHSQYILFLLIGTYSSKPYEGLYTSSHSSHAYDTPAVEGQDGYHEGRLQAAFIILTAAFC